MAPEGSFSYGVGRRKTASAQVRVYMSGTGAFVVNDRPVDEYFVKKSDLLSVMGPIRTAGLGQYTITAMVSGGGSTGQSGAVTQGLARALVSANPELRGAMRRGGFLTRDPRMKERKKPGLKRARKAPQYTKR